MATLQSVCQLTKVNRLDHFLAILLASFLLIATTGPAFSDGGHGGAPIARPAEAVPGPNCGPRGVVLETLRKHGEDRVGSGATSTGALIELWVDEQDGSWTIVISPNPNFSCFPAHGEGWKITNGQPS